MQRIIHFGFYLRSSTLSGVTRERGSSANREMLLKIEREAYEHNVEEKRQQQQVQIYWRGRSETWRRFAAAGEDGLLKKVSAAMAGQTGAASRRHEQARRLK